MKDLLAIAPSTALFFYEPPVRRCPPIATNLLTNMAHFNQTDNPRKFGKTVRKAATMLQVLNAAGLECCRSWMLQVLDAAGLAGPAPTFGSLTGGEQSVRKSSNYQAEASSVSRSRRHQASGLMSPDR
jgi:hypothetical protein